MNQNINLKGRSLTVFLTRRKVDRLGGLYLARGLIGQLTSSQINIKKNHYQSCQKT